MEASWYVHILAAILVFKMAATWDLDSAIFHKGRQLESSYHADLPPCLAQLTPYSGLIEPLSPLSVVHP